MRPLWVWLVLAAVRSLIRIIQSEVLVPWLGAYKGGQIGALAVGVTTFLVALVFVPWLAAPSRRDLFRIGLIWVILTALLETALGQGLVPFELIVMGLSPSIAARVRGVSAYEKGTDA